MKPNQLYLIKKLNKKLERVEELNALAETRLRELEKQSESLNREIKKILYTIGQ
jgi:hypothetical protein